MGSPYSKIKIKNIDGPQYLVSQLLRILQTQSRERGLIKTNMQIILPALPIRCMAASFTVHILKKIQYSKRICLHLQNSVVFNWYPIIMQQ